MMRTGRYAYRTDALMGHKNAPGRAAAARGLALGAVTGKALCSLRGPDKRAASRPCASSDGLVLARLSTRFQRHFTGPS